MTNILCTIRLRHSRDLYWHYIVYIDLHGCGLLNEADSQHEPVALFFAQENPVCTTWGLVWLLISTRGDGAWKWFEVRGSPLLIA